MSASGKWIMPIAIGIMVAAGANASYAAGDAKVGKTVFKKCAGCHVYGTKGKRIGGDLKGIIGKSAGKRPGVKYSDAMKNSGVVWSEGKLKAFLAKPKSVVKGTTMNFSGVKNKKDLDNLIAYLKTGA